MKQVPLFIHGEFSESKSTKKIDVINPLTQESLAQVPFATEQEMQEAVNSAKEAFKTWKNTPVSERARLFLRYQDLIKKHKDELAEILAKENGKTFPDAQGDVWRGVEVVEQAVNIASAIMGETVENVATNIDSYSIQQPLGVCAGITPFNFPAMIPLWQFPMAIACGNTFILKPSEQDPMTPTRLAELFVEAGAPKGVLNVVHGGKEQVDFLLQHPDVKTISFVGSEPVARYIYQEGCKNLKRVQAFAGAKNHMIVMPDADKKQVIANLTGASCGAAGQRCMAISVALMVGESQEWIDELQESMSNIHVGAWDDPKADLGPLVSEKAKERVERLIGEGESEGATLLLDGRDFTVEGYPNGNWIGPTLFDNVTDEMNIYKEEIFGPVLCVVRMDTLEEAIEFINRNPFGNGTSIFTSSGYAARKFQNEVEAGHVGINIPIPVPLPFFSFGGWKASMYGDHNSYGKPAVRFFTRTKTMTTRWFDDQSKAEKNMTINLK